MILGFVLAEAMYRLLVPDIGRHMERLLAEALTAIVLGVLAAKLLQIAYRLRQTTIRQLQVIVETNHHIRNALDAISMSAYLTGDQQAIRVINESVERIDWTLKQILGTQALKGQTTSQPQTPKLSA